MPLVIGAFTTLAEAEAATYALLQAGFDAAAISALARTGGGRMQLAKQVAVGRVGQPSRLLNRTERRGAWAVVGALAGALATFVALLVLPRLGLDPLAPLRPYILPPLLTLCAILVGAAACGGIGALVTGSRGLVEDLAMRYGVRLDQGDTVLGVATRSIARARAAQETLALHGAILAHVTRGSLETAIEEPDALEVSPSTN